MRKLFATAYGVGSLMYNYYLKRMSENLIESSKPRTIEGVLKREGLQYYLEQIMGGKYALRLIDVYSSGIGGNYLGKRFSAVVISDKSVTAPEGFIAYCSQLKEVE